MNGTKSWPGTGAVVVNNEAWHVCKEVTQMCEENGRQSIQLTLGQGLGTVLICRLQKSVEDEGGDWKDVDICLLLHWDRFCLVLGSWSRIVPE
jgi:hypothetical protein